MWPQDAPRRGHGYQHRVRGKKGERWKKRNIYEYKHDISRFKWGRQALRNKTTSSSILTGCQQRLGNGNAASKGHRHFKAVWNVSTFHVSKKTEHHWPFLSFALNEKFFSTTLTRNVMSMRHCKDKWGARINLSLAPTWALGKIMDMVTQWTSLAYFWGDYFDAFADFSRFHYHW